VCVCVCIHTVEEHKQDLDFIALVIVKYTFGRGFSNLCERWLIYLF